jgi:hypothetical protein
VPDMSQEYSFYEGHSFDEAFIRERIGQDLRERYEVPKGLPRKLRALVRRLDQWPKPVWSSLRRELHNRPPAQLEQCPLVSLGDFVAAAIIVVEALARRTRSRVGCDAEYAARIILRTSNSGSLAMFTANRRASSLVSSFAADCRPWAHPPKHFTWCSSYQALKVWT